MTRASVISYCEWLAGKFGSSVSTGFNTSCVMALWHAQLWHSEGRVSVLTPSRLTCEQYEVFPIATWKARTESYDELADMIAREHGVVLPRRVVWQALECGLVPRVKGRASTAS